ncbi:PREDICTED: 5-hydroxytryptamine receptor 3C-like [Cyprinodon variegatus]|uniref:5-hydroxytryptamine receptor 3C-like n=1 Tax=Cyprinodon variegatus TaxID=28743 RepID=UPI0007429D46|nr:PREDICTED: 5-hydroxytryptamine receptor 3C-like [Cyprinodon variegatus]
MASKESTLKGFLSSTTVFILILNTPGFCSTFNVNCSKADQEGLLAALGPVIDLKAIRPVVNQTTCSNITVYFTLYGILGVDEKSQVLITYIWLHYWWMIEFARWNPVQCGLEMITLPKKNFWLPDIVISEFMEENKAPSVPYLHLYSDGRVQEGLPLRVVSSCNLDIYTFPFDIQNCSMTFNSYVYDATEINVILGRDPKIITASSKNVMTTLGEWELLDITAQKPMNDVSDLYIDRLVFYIRVRRRATMYVVTLLLPSCFLITVDLFSFLLPPQSTDRSSFKMTLILGYTVFLLIMSDLLPITGNTIPLINVFFSLCLVLMVGSLLETIFITYLLNNASDFSPVPQWVQAVFLNFLGCLVCMPRRNKKPKDSGTTNTFDVKPPKTGGPVEEDEALQELKSLSHILHTLRLQAEQQTKETQSSEEWIQVGFIIDRLLFGLYIVFISVAFITIIVVWVNSSNQ